MVDVWIEKYRPAIIDEIEGNPTTMQRLKNIALDGNMPNLLICGPPGTGKTTSILALARHLLGEHLKKAVMELNASDERGIDVVRDKIKSFAKEKIDLPLGRQKIVILDEVDSMTEIAQQALRRLMEVYSDSTRFALACNQSTKIIEPIQSRCAIIRFGKLQDEQILKRLLKICRAEKIEYVNSGLEALVFTADGDMRNAINSLQSTVNGFGLVNKENVMKVCDTPPPEIIKSIIDFCIECKWSEAHETASELLAEGYTVADILTVMKSILRRSSTIAEAFCLEYYKCISRRHFMTIEGVSSPLQLDAVLGQLCNISMQFTRRP